MHWVGDPEGPTSGGPANPPDRPASPPDERSPVVSPPSRSGMIEGWGSRTCGRLTTARDGGLTTVPCVKGEYALRINEIRGED
jgi:hypothetical protein